MKRLNDSYVEGVIKKAANGKMTTGQAAARLGCTKQYVNKLKRKYESEGKAAFSHGNSGKPKKWRTPPETERRIAELYAGKYAGLNFRHFLEKLAEAEGIRTTYPTLLRILKEAGFSSPKHRKKRKSRNEHPSRPRKDNFGEMLQIDASIHNWFGEALPKATLHGAIDDATGTVMGLWFDREETLNGYFEMTRQILEKYGIPACFYGDNRTVFEYRKLSERNQTIDRDVHIQFKRMCQQLGIELITTSVSQAKGRIERLWGTLQSRLVSELRLNGITSIEGANAFLPKFTADFNRRFAIQPKMESSLFAPAPTAKEIDFYLSVQYERKADNGSCFSLNGSRMGLFDDDGSLVAVPPKTKLDVYVTKKGKTIAVFGSRLYEAREMPERESLAEPKKAGRPKWIPPQGHPWRKFVLKPKKK